MLQTLLAILLIILIVIVVIAMIIVRTVYKGFSWFHKVMNPDADPTRFKAYREYSGQGEEPRQAGGRTRRSPDEDTARAEREPTIIAAAPPKEKIFRHDEGEYTDYTEE